MALINVIECERYDILVRVRLKLGRRQRPIGNRKSFTKMRGFVFPPCLSGVQFIILYPLNPEQTCLRETLYSF